MKSLKMNLSGILMVLFFMLALIACKPEEAAPCDGLVCQNGGTLVDCACDCPSNYYGDECQTFNSACADYSCPSGQKPNPDKDCQCE